MQGEEEACDGFRHLKDELHFVPPEVLQDKNWTKAGDIWSLGVLLYEMCANRTPFVGFSDEDLKAKIKKGTYYHFPCHFSSELKNLVGSML